MGGPYLLGENEPGQDSENEGLMTHEAQDLLVPHDSLQISVSVHDK